MFVARLSLNPRKSQFACYGKKIGAAQKNTLNLSFNVNFNDYRSSGLYAQGSPTHTTPAESLQVLRLVVAAFGQRHLVDDL